MQARGGLEQGGGVGVARVTEHRLAVSLLDDPAQVHDRHSVREVAHDGEVVGDEDDRETEAGAEIFEQAQDRRLDRDVEGRHRFVGDDHPRLDGKSPGDGDALALAAGELARQAVEGVARQADEVHELQAAALETRGGHKAVDPEQLSEHLADAHAGVE